MHRAITMTIMLAIAAALALSATARAQVKAITLTPAEYQALVDELVRRDPALALLLDKQQQAQRQAAARDTPPLEPGP